jgi:ribonuclease T2
MRFLPLALLLALFAAVTPATAQERGRPGDFDYYVLVLSWSPTYCETARNPDESQCSGRRPYAFVLHGLWPQYRRGYPQDCRTRERPWVDNRTIDRILPIMPSRQLIIHEYRKHGTCAGLSADEYFDTARRLYESVRIPSRYLSPNDPVTVSPGELVDDFVKTNPELKPDMIAVDCDRRSLREIRICFSRGLRPQPCGENENPRKLCRNDRVVMPPVRERRFGRY